MISEALVKKYETVDVVIAILIDGLVQPHTSVSHSTFGCYPYVCRASVL